MTEAGAPPVPLLARDRYLLATAPPHAPRWPPRPPRCRRLGRDDLHRSGEIALVRAATFEPALAVTVSGPADDRTAAAAAPSTDVRGAVTTLTGAGEPGDATRAAADAVAAAAALVVPGDGDAAAASALADLALRLRDAGVDARGAAPGNREGSVAAKAFRSYVVGLEQSAAAAEARGPLVANYRRRAITFSRTRDVQENLADGALNALALAFRDSGADRAPPGRPPEPPGAVQAEKRTKTYARRTLDFRLHGVHAVLSLR